MSQGAIAIANGSGASVRAAINAALARLQTKASGTGRPADITTYETWIETDNPGSGIVSIWQWDGTNDVLLGLFDTVAHKNSLNADVVTVAKVTADQIARGALGTVKLTGTTLTLDATHNGKILSLFNASPITVDVPDTLPDGFSCTIYQQGAGQVSLNPAVGLQLLSYVGGGTPPKTQGLYARMQLEWLQSSGGVVFYVSGNITI